MRLRLRSSLRSVLHPSTLVPSVIIGGVVAVVVVANLREMHRSRASSTSVPAIGMPGAPRTSRADLDRRVATMTARLAAHPDDVGASVLLADALVRQMRVTGNVGLAVRAEGVLRDAARNDPGNYDVNRMLGTLYLAQHRFRAAIDIGERNRAARPYDPVNDGIVGDAHLELGEYREAFDAFDRMMARRPSAPAYARVAYARELQGDLAGACEAMRLAADATGADDPEALAWTHAQLGELWFQLGRLHDAKQEYVLASHAFPGHPFAVVGYAKVVAAEGDLTGALTMLQDLARRAPTPDLAARVGDLLARLGRRDEAERQYALAETGWRVDAPEPKNLARFLADHGQSPGEAVRIAEQAAAGRHDIFTEDALAWAYFMAGRVAEAARASAEALGTGTRDREILYHAAAIADARGDGAAAKRLVARALDGNGEFDLVAAPAARALRERLEGAPQVASR